MLVAGTACFVAVEYALVAVDRSRVESESAGGDRRARAVARLLARLPFHLSGAQLGITVTSVVLGFVAERASGNLAAALVLATVVQTVFGELVPRALAIARPERVARAVAPLASAYGRAFGPVIRVVNGAAKAAVRRLGIEPTDALTGVRSLEELELLIESSGEQGHLDPEAYSVLRRALRFGDKTAADALVPRVDVRWVPADATVDRLVELAVETGHSRFPVCADDLDEVVGVVHVKDVYRLPYRERASTPVTEIAVKPWVVPETADLTALLGEFRRLGTHLAVVVDEYGGTAGVLTLEDVLEEVVGDIEDEYDVPHRLSTVTPAGTYVLPGTLHPDEVDDACGLRLPDGPYETLAGFVVERLGRIPKVGDSFEHEGWRVEVAEMDRLRVASVRLTAP